VKTAAKATGLEAHHLLEKRFARLVGVKPSQMQAIALPREVHQVLTNAWRRAIGYGQGTTNATRDQVAKAAREIYARYAELIQAANKDLAR
jgi:uncharacterized protein YfaA (DUF2138 family)